MLKLEYSADGEKSWPEAAIDKRVYAPGYVLRSTCPNCGYGWVCDLAREYVKQYPVSGHPIDVVCYCESCKHEWVAGRMCYRLVVEVTDSSEPGTPGQ